jgi:hypothetical protein
LAEPTLQLSVDDIEAKLGVFAGWGRGLVIGSIAAGDRAWSPYEQAVITDARSSGLRRFYYPTAIEGMAQAHQWSFLKPTCTLALASGAQTIPLPDDYGGFEGQLTVLTQTQTAQPWIIEWSNAPLLRQKYSFLPNTIGPPMFAAEDPLKGTGPTQGQRSQLLIFPAADQNYTLQGNYRINPDNLTSGTYPYAYGGPEHIETILESCLAVMEERLDDMSGNHAAAFARRLVASIGMDQSKQPKKFGKNIDRSDQRRAWSRSDVHWWAPAATINGQPFQ